MSLNFITKLLVLLLLPLLFTAVSCNKPTEPPPPENYALEIIAVDASCTEVWIDVKSPNTLLPQSFTLTENGEEKGSVTINKADTTIIIENLLPKKSYKYQLKNTEHKSNETEITTLDTTSHNFTWQTFEFGQHSSSVLYDVAIIDENNIWAVGEIYMNDSNGNPDPKSYNAAHWDGQRWELIKMGGYGGYPRRTVFAFSENDVWFDGVIKWDGEIYTVHQNGFPIMPNGDGWQINKMWGSSSNDLYAVGNGGNIAHWNGSSWKKIESGTSLNIYDIWGDYNKIHQSYEIIVVAAKHMTSLERKLLILKNNSSNELSTANISQGSLHGIWFKNEKRYYVVGNGIYTKGKISSLENWKRIDNGLTQNYIYGISGTDYNNIFLCGSFGEALHYNGVSWQSYRDIPGFFKNEFFNTAIKGNTVVVVGYDGNKAFIAKGDN